MVNKLGLEFVEMNVYPLGGYLRQVGSPYNVSSFVQSYGYELGLAGIPTLYGLIGPSDEERLFLCLQLFSDLAATGRELHQLIFEHFNLSQLLLFFTG